MLEGFSQRCFVFCIDIFIKRVQIMGTNVFVCFVKAKKNRIIWIFAIDVRIDIKIIERVLSN